MGYKSTSSVKVLKTRHEVFTYRRMTARDFKKDLSNVPDDAVLLGFEDYDMADGEHTLYFQKEEELEED